jgi:AcrR family transcriptional regulator
MQKPPPNSNVRPNGFKYDQKLEQIIKGAADVFAEKGYGAASIRDIARKTGMSLAGLYYYFGSKDQLLYFIQKHSFELLLSSLEAKLKTAKDPVDKVRVLVRNHLEYFLTHMREMKVLSHEAASLNGDYLAEINNIKKRYFKVCLGVMAELNKAGRAKPINPRIAVMSLFGMMNWIYNWYDPRRDGGADELANHMLEIFLGGISR